MRFVQLRLKLVIARCPGWSESGPWPKHGPHQLWRIPAPTERNTLAMLSPSSLASGRSICCFTPPEPGKTTNSFAALWLIPRLAGFTRTHPGVDVRIMAETRVQDLDRDGLDVAVRHGPASLAGSNAVRLMGERVFPVCSPKLLKDKSKPLREPQDLRYHCLLQYDDPEGRHPWLHWKTWLEVERIADLRPAGTLSFSGYEQIIPAAIAGHGVALGRSPLVKDLIASGELVAPFKSSADPSRAYYAVVSKSAEGRPEVAEFVVWLRQEAGKR